jgi:hypothetical protein
MGFIIGKAHEINGGCLGKSNWQEREHERIERGRNTQANLSRKVPL